MSPRPQWLLNYDNNKSKYKQQRNCKEISTKYQRKQKMRDRSEKREKMYNRMK